MIAVARRIQQHYVDFARVPLSQWKIHDRLENWARWSRGASAESARTAEASPMFSLYRSSEAKRTERYGELTSVPIDNKDAYVVADAIVALPDKHRRALQWSYLRPRNPTSQARELGVSMEGLAQLVDTARFKLIDMGL